ncbi:hypothetical protein CBL_01749 [Carabus blaptoides fortunei]
MKRTWKLSKEPVSAGSGKNETEASVKKRQCVYTIDSGGVFDIYRTPWRGFSLAAKYYVQRGAGLTYPASDVNKLARADHREHCCCTKFQSRTKIVSSVKFEEDTHGLTVNITFATPPEPQCNSTRNYHSSTRTNS